MSDTLTRVTLPGAKAFRGVSDWGVHDAAHGIKQARAYAAHLRAQADEVEAAADSDFQVDIIRGRFVQHHVRTVQEAPHPSPPPSPAMMGERG